VTLLQRLLNGIRRIERSQAGMFVTASGKIPKRCDVGKTSKIIWNSSKSGHRKIVNDMAILFELSVNAHRLIVPNAERFAGNRFGGKARSHDGARRVPSCKTKKFPSDSVFRFCP